MSIKDIKDRAEEIENPDTIQTFDSLYRKERLKENLKEKNPDRAADTLSQQGFVELGQGFIEKHVRAFKELAQ